MLPQELKAVDRLVAAHFYQCLMEFFSTNASEKWILLLRHEEKGNLEFLLDIDEYYSFVSGLKQCINAALNSQSTPGVSMMHNTIARDLETTQSNSGAISIISVWDDEPNVQFNFYQNENDRESITTLIYALEDAMKLHDLYCEAYNRREYA